ncbi:MAG: endonuclease III domain-containing protein [Hydrogenobaculum sp.]
MTLIDLYQILLSSFGYQNWWPIDTDYHKTHNTDPKDEIIIGAILTQNTNWNNVEKALENLKNNKLLSLKAIKHVDIELLKELIRPSGFFQRKAKILKEVSNLEESPTREILLNIKGIGKETADSILLYAYNKPYFVIDMYTKRLLDRLFDITFKEYDHYASFITSQIPQDIDIYKEYHALIVEHAKRYCRKTPNCGECILKDMCIKKDYNKERL